MSDLLSGLNDEQREVALSHDAPTLVLAGPGTGKTHAVIHRIAHLIDSGSEPSSIMALSFTNKSAAEMRARVNALIGATGRKVIAGTFHSVLMREVIEPCVDHAYVKALGFHDGFNLYDGRDADSAFRKAFESAKTNNAISGEDDIKASDLSSIMGLARSWNMTVDEFSKRLTKQHAKYELYKCVIPVWRTYEKIKRADNAIDFDDVISLSRSILAGCPDIRMALHERIKHIIVDEYQDTNMAQFQVLRLLAGQRDSLCVVGDYKQSIYKFRGSVPSIVQSFKDEWPHANTITLHRNYRSTHEVVRFVNNVAKSMGNLMAEDRALASQSDQKGEMPVYEWFQNDFDEADYVVDQIKSRIAKGQSPSEIGVLYRRNIQREKIEQKLIQENIPFKVSGDTGLLQKAGVKDLLSLWRMGQNPNYHGAVMRVVKRLSIGVTAERLESMCQMMDKTPYEVLKFLAESDGKRSARIAKLLTNLDIFRKADAAGAFIETEAFNEALHVLYAEYLHPEKRQKTLPMEAIESVKKEFLALARARQSIKEALDQLALLANIDRGTEAAVQLSTCHAAKGLEFQTVFFIGVEESKTEAGDKEDLAEEWRVFYVAVSRAKKDLLMSSVGERQGLRMRHDAFPSLFLEETGIIEVNNEHAKGWYLKGLKAPIKPSVNHTLPPVADIDPKEAWQRKIAMHSGSMIPRITSEMAALRK